MGHRPVAEHGRDGVNLDLAIDPGWAIGLLLAQIRVAAFTIASPQIGKAIGSPGRMAFAIAVSVAISTPVEVPTIAALVGHGLVNAALGGLLGYMIGILFHLFAIGGTLADLSAGTSIASILDPTQGEQAAIFSRIFSMTALTLFHIGGGLTLLVTVLGWSMRVVPLDGQIRLDPGLGQIAIDQTGTLMVVGFELAAPIVASLFLIELTLGLAARFAPTANVFMLGMPVKVGVAMIVSVTSLAMFPQFMTALIDTTRDTMVDVLNGVGVAA
ncbi:MAG: flagellar biosynthetic protein FliR [Myxococcota bacterium]|jgi:flagellar biosynthetic protein FliR